MCNAPENYESFQAEIEEEYAKRVNDYISLENYIRLRDEQSEEISRIVRNTLIVMMYSCYEGFCKRAFEIYIDYVNKTKVKIRNLKTVLVASSLAKDFKKIEDTSHVPNLNGINFEKNKKLKRFARRVEFTESLSDIFNKQVLLTDELTDTESNLTADVLERIMFTLGLDYSGFDDKRGDINMIVRQRNDAAHGTFDREISDAQYKAYKKAVFGVVNTVKEVIQMNYRTYGYLVAVS